MNTITVDRASSPSAGAVQRPEETSPVAFEESVPAIDVKGIVVVLSAAIPIFVAVILAMLLQDLQSRNEKLQETIDFQIRTISELTMKTLK